MPNFFDQFDETSSGGGTISVRPYRENQQENTPNFFDQFDVHEQSQEPESGTVSDIAKSAAAGVARGVSGLVGLPGDVGRLMKAGADYLVGSPSPELGGTPVTSEQAIRGIESVTGPLHDPQTTAGEYARTIGEFIPAAALGPGGAVRSALRYGVVPAIASETAGQATKGTEAEPYARAAAGIATGGALALRDRPHVPLAATDTSAAPEFNIPLSRGQAKQSVTDQIAEQAALRGGLGKGAEAEAKDFFEKQRAATEAARTQIGADFDQFGQPIASSPQEAAELTGETVRNLEKSSRQGYRKLYDEALSLPGEFHAGTFEGIANKIKGNLTLGQNPVIIDDVTTPVASRVLKDVEDQIGNLKVQNRADYRGAPKMEDVIGINLQGVDQARKRLISLAQGAQRGSADARASRAVIGEFDNAVEDAIANGLFSGDERALNAIRAARKAYSEHRKTFTYQGKGDDVGRAIERIVGRENGEGATATEISRYLYGEAKTGATGLSVRLAHRLRDMVGDQSPEWAGIRQGLWSHLTAPTPGIANWGPGKIANRITEFINGSGNPLARSIFSKDEIGVMQRFAGALKKLEPLPGAVNTSNSATVFARLSKNLFDVLSGMIGFHAAGPLGGVGADMAKRIGSHFINQGKAVRLFNPTMRIGNQQAAIRAGLTAVPSATQSGQ